MSQTILLILICALSFILRIPSFTFPLDYDVGGSLFNGMMVAKAGFYSASHGLRPFGSLAIYALIYKIFGSSTVYLNMVGAIFWVFSTFLLYKLTVIISNNRKAGLFASLIFAFFNSSRALQGEMTNLETFFIPFALLGLCFFFSSKRKTRRIYLTLSGLSFSAAFLIKHSAIFSFLAVFLFDTFLFFSRGFKKKFKSFLIENLLLASGFVLLILLISLYFLTLGQLREFYYWQFFSIPSNVSHYQSLGNAFLNLRNNFLPIFSKTYFFWILGLLGIISSLFFKRRPERTFLLFWLLSVFSGIYYLWWFFPHHFLQLIPPVSIFASLFLSDLYFFGEKRWDKSQFELKKRLIIVILFFALALFLQADAIYFVSFFQKLSGQIDRKTHLAQVGFDVGPDGWLSFYEAADYIKEKAQSEESIFVWASTPVIYALAEKEPIFWAVYKYAFLPNELKPPAFRSWFPNTNELKRELMKELARTYPTYILFRVEPEKVFYEMLSFQKFSHFIANNYTLEQTSGNILIYKKNKERPEFSENEIVIPFEMITRFAAITSVEEQQDRTIITFEPMVNPNGILRSFKAVYPGIVGIDFEPITLAFPGQDGYDFVGGGAYQPSGVIDLHIKVRGIKKPVSFARVKTGRNIWNNLSYGVNPPLKVIQTEVEVFDLYFEPPSSWQGETFNVYFIYKDGSGSSQDITLQQ